MTKSTLRCFGGRSYNGQCVTARKVHQARSNAHHAALPAETDLNCLESERRGAQALLPTRGHAGAGEGLPLDDVTIAGYDLLV